MPTSGSKCTRVNPSYLSQPYRLEKPSPGVAGAIYGETSLQDSGSAATSPKSIGALWVSRVSQKNCCMSRHADVDGGSVFGDLA